MDQLNLKRCVFMVLPPFELSLDPCFGRPLYFALPKFVAGHVAFLKAALFHLQYAGGSPLYFPWQRNKCRLTAVEIFHKITNKPYCHEKGKQMICPANYPANYLQITL